MTSLTSLKHHTKIGKSKTESVLNFFPPFYIVLIKVRPEITTTILKIASSLSSRKDGNKGQQIEKV